MKKVGKKKDLVSFKGLRKYVKHKLGDKPVEKQAIVDLQENLEAIVDKIIAEAEERHREKNVVFKQLGLKEKKRLDSHIFKVAYETLIVSQPYGFIGVEGNSNMETTSISGKSEHMENETNFSKKAVVGDGVE
jgi:hypothetical protein